MKRLLFVAAICMVVAPALASPELLPAKAPHYATYDAATGGLTPTPGPVRYGDAVWSSMYGTGWYWSSHGEGCVPMDWGDSGDPASPYVIDGFMFWYQTDMAMPERLDAVIWYYGEENGWNSYNHVPLAGFIVTGLPSDPPQGASWIITVDLEDTGYEFELSGSDMDGDGLVDFGYTYWFMGPDPADATGPIIAIEHPDAPTDPNIAPAPGIENAFDFYTPTEVTDPNDPNQGVPDVYEGTYWFGGDPFAQFAMELKGSAGNAPQGCASPGDSGWYCTADIEYTNECVVDLLDLATLLQNYGTTTGATHEMGDVEPEDGNGVWDPTDGDGDVDLADLARLLTQYGDDCR